MPGALIADVTSHAGDDLVKSSSFYFSENGVLPLKNEMWHFEIRRHSLSLHKLVHRLYL